MIFFFFELTPHHVLYDIIMKNGGYENYFEIAMENRMYNVHHRDAVIKLQNKMYVRKLQIMS